MQPTVRLRDCLRALRPLRARSGPSQLRSGTAPQRVLRCCDVFEMTPETKSIRPY